MGLNGLTKPEALESLMARWAGMMDCSPYALPIIKILSSLAGKDHVEFICRHTMRPFYRAIGSTDGMGPVAQKILERHPWLSAQDGLDDRCRASCFCHKCVDSDLELYGQSYWRRAHQIPGLLWCPTHDSPLTHVDKVAQCNRSPSAFVGFSLPIDQEWVEEAMSNPSITRYVALSLRLLERSQPFESDSVSNTLAEEASRQRFYVAGGRFSITYLLHEAERQFGKRWLDVVMPRYPNRKKRISIHCYRSGEYFEVDQRQPTFLTDCLLACAILYDSADQAIEKLAQCNSSPAKGRPSLGFQHNPEELISAYIRAQGNHYKVRAEFFRKIRAERLLNGLIAAGLPHLEDKPGRSSFNALVAFYLYHYSLTDSAAIGGIEPWELERL